MKLKSIIAVFVAASSVSSYAIAQGFYVQGDLGLANVKADTGEKFKVRNTVRDLKQSYKDSGFMPRLSVGYDLGDVRVAADYTHYKNVSDSVKDQNVRVDVKAKVRGVGVAAIYDIPLDSRFKPYVGARIGFNSSTASAKVTAINGSANLSASESKKETSVGFGALVGVGYEINGNLTADAGYRYNRLTSDVKAHEVSVGLRYAF